LDDHHVEKNTMNSTQSPADNDATVPPSEDGLAVSEDGDTDADLDRSGTQAHRHCRVARSRHKADVCNTIDLVEVSPFSV
jgi:hypothetical protein